MDAINSKLEKGITFLFSVHANTFANVTPTLIPVKEPGPIATKILSMSLASKLFLSNNSFTQTTKFVDKLLSFTSNL